AHWRGIGLHAPRFQDLKNLFDARLMADRRMWIFFRTPWFGRVFAGLAVDFVKFLGLRVIFFPIVIFDRPLRRNTVLVPERFKILFAQSKQGRTINLRVASDEITEARPDLTAVLVEHHLGRIILERAVITPIILLARQERPAFEHEDALAT